MNNPIISVIMPVYNAELYLKDAINSVLQQSFTQLELIIVNDGSTDHSVDIIQSYNDPRIKYFERENSGQTKASNFGLTQAKGDYIKFFDADDILHSQHLSSQYEVIQGSNMKLASCKWSYFYENVENIKFKTEYTHKNYENGIDWFYDSITKDQGMMGAWLWLIPKAIIKKAGNWNETLSLNNDLDFSARLLIHSKGVNFAPQAKIYYRKGIQGALTKSKSSKAFQSAIDTTLLAAKSILEKEDSPRMQKLFADRMQSWIFQFYPLYEDQIKTAEDYIKLWGGSDLKPEGGQMFHILNKILGWKNTYRLQHVAYKYGWSIILKIKEKNKKKQAIRKFEQ